MTPEELGHWRYRIKALERGLRYTEELISGPKMVYPDELNALLERQLLEWWLLEEARYMSELGEVHLALWKSFIESGQLNAN